jgi:hypothetical protein
VTREHTPASSGTSEGSSAGHAGSRLGPLLCWAVVFADIGTSVYYTPGILYRQVGAAAGLFVTLTMIVFLLLAVKYAEVSTRFPRGRRRRHCGEQGNQSLGWRGRRDVHPRRLLQPGGSCAR